MTDVLDSVAARPADSGAFVAAQPDISPRRILCVFPRYEPSLGSFDYAYDITGSLRAFMPPQGLLVIAASLPPDWQVRFVDENVDPAREEDFRWADAVFVSGMHVQRKRIIDICRARARRRQAGDPRRPIGVVEPRTLLRSSITCTSAKSATRRANCLRGSGATVRDRRRRCGLRPTIGCRSTSFPFPPTNS